MNRIWFSPLSFSTHVKAIVRGFLFIGFIFAGSSLLSAQISGPGLPTGLMTDMMEHTANVWVNGYPVNMHIDDPNLPAQARFVEIQSLQPRFGWVVNDTRNNVLQTSCQILVASQKYLLDHDSADMWNSGKLVTGESVSLSYQGKPLSPGKVYFWKVRTWNNTESSAWADVQSFRMANHLSTFGSAHYPLEKNNEYPHSVNYFNNKTFFADFGRDAFGCITITMNSFLKDTLKILLGEALKDGHIDQHPGGTIRCRTLFLPLMPGKHTYKVIIPPDTRNTGPNAIKIPVDDGEVTPFRYCELQGLRDTAQRPVIVRETLHYPFNDNNSDFTSSDKVLNDVWDLCKYSIKATSFTGTYVDGDRERIPYEADALINQLSHYAVDREFSMARFTHDYLMMHANWPTEWIMQSVLIAWNDYLYSGNDVSLRHWYQDLQKKTLTSLGDSNGLISTRTGRQTDTILHTIHFAGKELRDIVDWPQTGILGLGKNEPGETDGYIFTNYNTVVNCYYYRALTLMAKIAAALGYDDDTKMYASKAAIAKESINQLMFDSSLNRFTDGAETKHASLHANMFALAFGLVPEKYIPGVLKYIQSRGMACSVYGAQFLADAVYDAGDGKYGLSLLNSKDERSWAHMMYDVGSTITMEAWDSKYKPNQDWNHAWGAAPANIIARKLMGIEPIEPGFHKIQIKLQPGELRTATFHMATIRGTVEVSFLNKPEKTMDLLINLPANSTCNLLLPWLGKIRKLTMNGKQVTYQIENNFICLDNIGSGSHQIEYFYY